MENRLRKIFEYQRFANNSRLSAIIDNTESKYGAEISDSELELVSAAGIPEDLLNNASASEFVPI